MSLKKYIFDTTRTSRSMTDLFPCVRTNVSHFLTHAYI